MRRAFAATVAMVGVFGPAAAESPASSVWLVPSFIYEAGGSAPRRSEVAILNLSGDAAEVACHVYRETGERAERASQVKTFAPGASRSNEGGSLPCAFAFAESIRGWAVIVSSEPVLVAAHVCEGQFCPDRTPMAVVSIDCSEPAGLAIACRHAPAPAAPRAFRPSAAPEARPVQPPVDRPPGG